MQQSLITDPFFPSKILPTYLLFDILKALFPDERQPGVRCAAYSSQFYATHIDTYRYRVELALWSTA